MMQILVIALSILTLVLFILIYSPIIIFHLKAYYLNRHHPVYQARFCIITIIQGVLFVLKLVFDAFYTISPIHLFGHHSTANKIVSAINTYFAAYLIYSFVWKFWLLRYNIILHDIVINSNWKSIINPQEFAVTDANTTFYVKHKQKLGNAPFVMWLLIIIATILTTIYNVIILFFPHIYGQSTDNSHIVALYSSWDYIIPYLLLLIIYFTVPQFHDNLYITEEMKFIFICLSLMYIAYFTHLVLFAFLVETVSKTTEDIGILLVNNIIIFAQFCALLISTKWVNARCSIIISSQRYSVTRVASDLKLSQKQIVEIRAAPNQDKNDLHGLVLETLSSTKMYHSFINFAASEMCIECVLSLTEFVQYRQYIKWYMEMKHFIGVVNKKSVNQEKKVMMEDIFGVALAEDIPRSWIVSNDEWDNKRKAYELYKKYVATGSDYEINISSSQRKHYKELLDDYEAFANDFNIEEAQLMKIFDSCSEEMVRLMMESMRRYQKHTFS